MELSMIWTTPPWSLDPNSTSSLDIEVETGNTVQDENFFPNTPEKQLVTEIEEPEEDFSHLSLEEQAVLAG